MPMTPREFLNKYPHVERMVEKEVRAAKGDGSSSSTVVKSIAVNLRKMYPKLTAERAKELAEDFLIA